MRNTLLSSLFLIALSAMGVTNTFYTRFPFPEQGDLDQRGAWLNTKVIAQNWSNCVIHPRGFFAYGNGGNSVSDSTAILSGIWGSNQCVVEQLGLFNSNLAAEVEIRLQSTISQTNNTGYEIDWDLNQSDGANFYLAIVRWNGLINDFTILTTVRGTQFFLTNTMYLRGEIVGTNIYAYVGQPGAWNLMCVTNDVWLNKGRWTNGAPGFGFDHDVSITGNTQTNWGITQFYASDDLSYPRAIADGWRVPPNIRTQAGIPGGIPRRPAGTNVVGLDGTGATDVTPTLKAILLANKNTHTAVVLPAGVFKLSTSLDLQPDCVLRGSGTNTILKTFAKITTENTTPGLGITTVNLTTNAYPGDVAVTVGSSQVSVLTAGCMMLIDELNNTNFVNPDGWEDQAGPYLCSYCDNRWNGTRVRGQMVLVTNVTATTIGFTPPLFSGYQTTNTARIEFFAWPGSGTNNTTSWAGVEDLTIDNSAGNFDDTMLNFQSASFCWVSNVTFAMSGFTESPGVKVIDAMNIEGRHCYFTGGYQPAATNAWGWYQFVDSGNSLFEDNIGYRMKVLWGQAGIGAGNVCSYNFDIAKTNTTTALVNDYLFHGAHPDFTIIEGNYGIKLDLDEIHGSSSMTAVYKNWWLVRLTNSTYSAIGTQIDATNWWASPVGNIYGFTGIITNDLGYKYQYTSDAAGSVQDSVIKNFCYSLSGNNRHAIDPHSQDTALRDWNYNYVSNQVEYATNFTGTGSFPNSLLYASTPAFYNGYPLTFPSIYSASNPPTAGKTYTNWNPAGYRYEFGDPTALPPLASVTIGGSVRLGGGAKINLP